ncbi:MAG: hypothetical protein OEV42_06275 [Deltaproteobacteria bacterium]|nr:hypothetical protein [Deltaproteobacteria bacterium]
MSKLYKDKYRVESARLKGWDYSGSGYYFVTICTKGMKCYFGDINNGAITLSETGVIIAEEWNRTERIRENVSLDQWIVMPNHFHGIIIINNNVETSRWDVSGLQNKKTPHRGVSTSGLKAGTLGAIIGQFKSISTKRCRLLNADFAWQPRFHDHIIRNEKSLQEIREYIENNAQKWELDRYHPNCRDAPPGRLNSRL